MFVNIGRILRHQSIMIKCFSSKAPINKNIKVDTKKDIKDFKDFLPKKDLQKTPIEKLEEIQGQHPYAEKEALPEWKDGYNPETGEIGGPRGPEPTRYGDWERKGRVTDF